MFRTCMFYFYIYFKVQFIAYIKGWYCIFHFFFLGGQLPQVDVYARTYIYIYRNDVILRLPYTTAVVRSVFIKASNLLPPNL